MKYAKAFTGSLLAGLGALGVALADNSVTNQEWVTIAIAFVATLAAVFGVPNADYNDPAPVD